MELVLPKEIDSLPSKPDVVVTFTGLIVLKIERRTGFAAGILPAGGHRLIIGLEERRKDNDELKQAWSYEQSGVLNEDFTIKVVNPLSKFSSYTRYQKPRLLNRGLLFEDNDLRRFDFRWLMNFQNFHETTLAPHADLFNKAVRLNVGHFYAHRLAPQATPNNPLFLMRENVFPPEPNQLYSKLGVDVTSPKEIMMMSAADVIGSNIYLDRVSGVVKLNWGKERGSMLPTAYKELRHSAEFYYKITFNNHDYNPKSAMSDMGWYYIDNGLPNPPVGERLDLYFKDQTSEEYPCVPIWLGPRDE